MKKEKKIIVIMAIISILTIAILSYFLINKNAIIEKQAEKIELQAMETNGSNSYVTTEKHLKEVNQRQQVVYLGTGTSFDLKSYGNYSEFTADDFIIEPIASYMGNTWYNDGEQKCKGYKNIGINVTKTYTDGILTAYVNASGSISGSDGGTFNASLNQTSSVKAYLIY